MHSRTALGFDVKISRHNLSQWSREERFTARRQLIEDTLNYDWLTDTRVY